MLPCTNCSSFVFLEFLGKHKFRALCQYKTICAIDGTSSLKNKSLWTDTQMKTESELKE